MANDSYQNKPLLSRGSNELERREACTSSPRYVSKNTAKLRRYIPRSTSISISNLKADHWLPLPVSKWVQTMFPIPALVVRLDSFVLLMNTDHMSMRKQISLQIET